MIGALLGRFGQYDPGFGRARPIPDGDVEEKRTTIEQALQHEGQDVDFTDVLRLRYWQSHRSRTAKPWRDLGNRYFDRLFAQFKSQAPNTDVALFADCGIGVYRTDSDLRYVVLNAAVRFDWSDAYLITTRIDGIAERAKVWWEPQAGDGKTLGGKGDGNSVRKSRRQTTASAELSRFVERAFGLMTAVCSTVDLENPVDGERSRLSRSQPYRGKLEVLRNRANAEEAELNKALQRSAQTCYGRGMFWGFVLVLTICIVIGGGLLLGDVPAWYAVAFPAGAAGALVSVLQRMSSSSPKSQLRLDFNAGPQMITYYGALRPLVGGLLGYMIFVFLRGSLFPALSITTTAPLATYVGLGFLGGFNERWAQDMLVGSAKRLEHEAG